MTSIGEEIKQKGFSSEINKLVINMLFTTSWLNAQHSKIFKKHDLTSQQFNALRILRGQLPNSASVNLIKERMIDKMSNVSRIIDKLKAKGLVTRRASRNDRRQVDVKITEKGLELLKILDIEIKTWESQDHNLSQQEAKTINALLDKWRG